MEIQGRAALLLSLAWLAFAGVAGAATIGLDEPPDRWVVQRTASAAGWAGELAISGTLSGSTSAVEARVVEALSGSEIAGWQVIDPAPSAGLWSGELVDIPQGGWYRVEARLVTTPSTSASAVGTFGVGLVVATIGQSNMVKMFTEDQGDGSLTPPFETPSTLTHRYGYGEPAGFEYARPRTVDVPISWGEVTGTGGIRLANSLAAELGVPILMLDFSIDWTGIDDHWNNDLHRSWQRFSEALDLIGEIGVVIWHQGAYDAHENQPSVASYKAGLDTLYQRITDRIGGFGSLPMLVAIQNRGDYDLLLAKDPTYDAVRQAQREWIGERGHGFAAGDSNDFDITTRPGTGNGHFWAREYQEMADRMARGALHALLHPGFEKGVDGGLIAGATVRGTTVQVEIAHDHGARLRLENAAADIEGFTLTDGDWLVDNGSGPERNHLQITSARLSDDQAGNWLELELATAPAGPVRLRYLYGQNPFYDQPTEALRRQNGNTLYDDFAYHPERSGLPIGGTSQDLTVGTAGAIVIGASSLSITEGGASFLNVSLSDLPGGNVTVTAMIHGDGDLVLGAGSLSFDDGNYSLPQALQISAGADADTQNGSALLRLTAPGQHGALVDLTEEDSDPHLEASPMSLEVSRAGGVGTFDVTLGTAPAGAVTVDISSADPASLAASPSTLVFTPGDWQTPQTVIVEGLLVGDVGAALTVDVDLVVDPAGSDDSYDAAPANAVQVDLVGLDDGLVLHWPLDESAGTVAADLSANGHHGLIGGDVSLAMQGVHNLAMSSAGPGGSSGSSADGIAGPGATGSGLPSASLDELSVSFWYRLGPNPHGGYLFTWGGSYNKADTVSLYLDPGNQLRVRVHDGADATSIESIAPVGFDDGAWHHLALVKDPSGSRVFLDGVQALSSSVGDGAITPASGVTLGTNEVGKYGIEASFDDLRVYGRALGAAEVQGLVTLGGGQLSVDLLPSAVAAAGARWRLQGDPTWHLSGESVPVPGGTQTLTFEAPAGWLTPADENVVVAFGESTNLATTFVQQGTGTLAVTLEPAAAGGQWQLLSDGIWRPSGDLVSLTAGDHAMTFSNQVGWLSPADRTLTVVEGVATAVTAYYVDAATADPIVHLPLDELGGALATDISSSGNDGIYGGDVTLGADGVFVDAASSGGQGGATGAYDDGIRISSLTGGYDLATVAFWYRLPAQAHDGYLMTWGGSYNDANQLSIYYNAAQNLRIRVRDAADTSSLEEVSPAGFDDDSWHHVAVSKGPSGTAIYFDGQLIRTSAMGEGQIAPPAGLRLGANENGQWGIEAAFDDLRAWARELPPPEIEALFAAGQSGSLTVDLLPAEAITAGARWRLTSGADTSWQISGATLTSLLPGAYALEFDFVPGWLTPASQALSIGIGDDLQRFGVYSLAGGPILEWRLDETVGSLALDTSGNGRDGAIGGDVQIGLVGLAAQAAATAGTGTSGGSPADAIVAADFAPDDSYTEATVSLWYRLDVIHDGYLFSWGGSYNDPDHLSLYLDPQAGLRYRVHDAGDTSSYLEVSPAGFADGGWHHVVLVTDAAGSRAYFDGAQVAANTMGQGVVTPQDLFTVGANENGTFGIEASFDEVAIWDRALGDAEIAQLFGAQGVVSLRVDLEPAQAIADGGQWRLTTGSDTGWHQDGETILVQPGPNTVTFETLAAWRNPADVAIDAELGTPLALQAIYRGLDDGQLRVDLSPAGAVESGAEWRLVDGPDGGIWRSSAATITVPAGGYTLELAPAAGYLTPDPQTIEVPANDLLVQAISYSVGGGPILHWPLDAASPGNDVAGFGRHAAVGSDVATGLGGVIGEAVQTAGPGGAEGEAADGLETADFDSVDAYDEASVALWYRLPAQPHDGYLFAWGGSNADPDHLSAFLDAGTELRIRVHDSLDTTSVLSVVPPSFDNAAWHHVAVVKDLAGSRIYFDGALVASHIMGSGTVRPIDGFFLGMSQKREFGLEATFDDVRVWDRVLSDLEISNLVAATPPPDGFGGAYRTVDELHADIQQAALDYPAIVEVLDYGDSYAASIGGHTTPGGDFLAGDDLLAVRVTNRSIAGQKPLFVLMACLHAREIATPELAMRLIAELTELYGIDADITWLVDHHEVWILPLTNPDGHRHVELGAELANGAAPWRWRKNVRPGGSCAWPPLDGSSTEGVDLNRNFPFQWGTSSGQAGSSDQCSENYRGAAAGSEPETVAIMALIQSLIPDQRGPALIDPAPTTTTGLFVQLHSPFRTVSWPWAHSASPAPNAVDLQAIGEKLAAIAGYESGQTHDAIYRMTGTADDWVYSELGAPALLMEVGEGLMPPYHKIDGILWPEVRDAFVHAAKISRAPYQLAHGPDASALQAIAAAGGFDLDATADDLTSGGLSIAAAEAYVSLPPWDASALAVPLSATDGAFDEISEDITGFLDTSGLAAGPHTVWVRAQDSAGHWGPPSAVFIDVP